MEDLLNNRLDQLRENNAEAEKVRDTIRGIRAEFKLYTDPMTPVKNFEDLTMVLAEVIYRPALDVQTT